MRLAFCATVLLMAALTVTVAVADSPRAPRTTLAQFIALSQHGGGACCQTPLCAAPASCEPACCPAPACEPKCCPTPRCEPVCSPAPVCCPPLACGGEPCAPCCASSCSACCVKEYPLEKMLNRLDRAIFGKKDCCRIGCDPYGYDLWPCVGQCCPAPAPYGQAAPIAPPTMLDPRLLRPQGEDQINPFQDDPEQPPKPPTGPTRTGIRNIRAQPAASRLVR